MKSGNSFRKLYAAVREVTPGLQHCFLGENSIFCTNFPDKEMFREDVLRCMPDQVRQTVKTYGKPDNKMIKYKTEQK